MACLTSAECEYKNCPPSDSEFLSDSEMTNSSCSSEDCSATSSPKRRKLVSANGRGKACEVASDAAEESVKTVDEAVIQQAAAMAKLYRMDEDAMRQLLRQRGDDSTWFVMLMTTTTDRKTSTHVSRTRSPFRKNALHNCGSVPTKTTRGALWIIRLMIGPFGNRASANRFKNELKQYRTPKSRLINGISDARAIKMDYKFAFEDDKEK